MLPAQQPPPTNLQAEAEVLGAMLLDGSLTPSIEGLVEAKHFADPVHARIFEALRAAHATADRARMFATLGPALEEVGGIAYLGHLADGQALMPSEARQRAGEIRGLWVRRILVDIGDGLTELGQQASAAALDIAASGCCVRCQAGILRSRLQAALADLDGLAPEETAE